MKNNLIKNQLILGLGAYAMLLGLNNLSATAQQRKPTTAEIQQAKTNLSQHVQSLRNSSMSHRVEDSRTPQQKQDRDRLVNAWQQVDPQVTPFVGSWKGYETVWNIYPSNNKGRVCVVRRELDVVTLDFGTVVDNTIHTEQGMVFFKEGNYLGIGTIANNQFRQINDLPLNSPDSLKELYSFKTINGLPPSSKILKSYAKADCTASFPSQNYAKQTTIQELADGDYVYGEIPYPDVYGIPYTSFRKSGNLITGTTQYLDGLYCFEGTIENNTLINATTFSQAVGTKPEIKRNQSISLNELYHIDNANTENVMRSVEYCMTEIAHSSTPSPQRQIRIPDSFKVALDNGMKTELVKGKDGYYTWFVTNYFVSGTCLGLKENKNPAKVQLATYSCNSKKKARTWEIVMANNNTGFKVKLPNTPYCLADNVGIVDCNSPKATVKDLTSEQLNSWRSQ
ncbi:hypothetical protein [Pleurocapsa sp. PCC 7319]|uniref:hypothetical protein n=1 Tax=Pleurocapsa sp. PCC 7319 TaxID=118161 RepID=UPI0003454FEE|nr:hypothetical protein [Pleurocapsa sp. PCC 7319]